MTAAYDRDALPESCREQGHEHGCPCAVGGDELLTHDRHIGEGLSDPDCRECERGWEYWNMRPVS